MENLNVNVIDQYVTDKMALYNGDSCEIMKAIPDNSIDFSISSPPFASLYTFSNSDRDLGNCKDLETFINQFRFIAKELFRIVKEGRLVAIHTMDLTTSKGKDGYLSVIDFGGMIIKLFQEVGFYFHCPITIPKDPVIEVTRTKNIQLLYHQFCKDASISRSCLPDRLFIFRKPGENKEPITHDKDKISPNDWGKLATCIWGDIRQTNVLNARMAREEQDEKHLSCLQLDVIERAITLWTNPNDIVFTPFMGIGSEVYQALKMGRRGVGIELKESYFEQSVRNCQSVIEEENQLNLFEEK